MTLGGSKDDLAQDLRSLDTLIEELATGDNVPEVLKQMQALMEYVHFFTESINKAYERISEVTTAFNKAFLYKEEAYSTRTILDIFKTHGYEDNDSK